LANENKLILIAGGDGKGADFSPLQLAIAEHINAVITLGKDGDEILSMASTGYSVSSIEQAVEQANDIAKAGDVVLLSPACASIDMFKNFAQRGDKFVFAVQQLQEAS
jgi:UDP-N-acetylmuramoylalanine--D-glutamate ligase